MNNDNVINKIIDFMRTWDKNLPHSDNFKPRERIVIKIIGDYESERGNGISMSEISAECMMPKPVITLTVDGLENSGLLKRESSRIDRRSVRVNLTKEGKIVYARICSEMQECLERFVTEMGEKDASDLFILLNKANNVMSRIIAEKIKQENKNA